jgi:hypothetical protein
LGCLGLVAHVLAVRASLAGKHYLPADVTDETRDDVAQSLVAAGWAALEVRDLEGARRSFEAALLTGDDPQAYEGLGWVAWWANDAGGLFPARERAYALYRQQGDRVSAARQAIWLGCDHHDFRAEHAVANGWYQRARRLRTEPRVRTWLLHPAPGRRVTRRPSCLDGRAEGPVRRLAASPPARPTAEAPTDPGERGG